MSDDPIRRLLRSSTAWIALRRWQREGFFRAFHRHQLWKRVLNTNPVRTACRSSSGIEVHILCHRLDYLTAIWAIKTFYVSARVDFPLVIHVNGTAESKVYGRLQQHFPDAAVIPRIEADRAIEPRLTAGFPNLLAARRASPFMLKLVDFSLLAEGATVLGLDSDILFFENPRDLLYHATHPGSGYTFQRDPENNYNLSDAEATAEFGIQLTPRVNTGLLVYRRDLPDLTAFERYLGHSGVSRPNGFIEQTLYALHASEIGGVNFLPDTYRLDLQAGLPYAGVIARHYAGPSRSLLTTEGIPEVIRKRLLEGAS